MAKPQKLFVPVIDRAIGRGRPWFAGEDEHGPYVAVQIISGPLAGEYVLVSPEDRFRVMLYGLSSHFNTSGSPMTYLQKKRSITYTGAYIWRFCMFRHRVPKIYGSRHPLDMRRDALGVHRYTNSRFYGVSSRQGNLYRVRFPGNWTKRVYLGLANTEEAAARLYNDELRRRQLLESRKPEKERDRRIMYMKFNDVTPLFTPREAKDRRFDLAAMLADGGDDSAAA